MSLKQLKMGKCLEDLHVYHELPKHLDIIEVQSLTIRSLNVFFLGEEYLQNGDEEQAYIHFVKFIKLIMYLEAKSEFKKKYEMYKIVLGVKNIYLALDSYEALTKSLKRRYAVERSGNDHASLQSCIVRINCPPAAEIIKSRPAKRVRGIEYEPPAKKKKIVVTLTDIAPEQGSKGQGLTGLYNLGNTCYMNSIMQCLSNTDLLVKYLTTDSYKAHLNRSNETQGKVADELSAVLREIWCDKYRYISSKNFRKIVGEFHQLFRGTAQQDSHEFFTILIDWLHSDLQISDQQLVQTRQQQNILFVNNKTSKIVDLFYGQMKCSIKCKTCKMESVTYESFSSLSLELVDDIYCHINDCMKMYFSAEQINAWNCPSCKTKRTAVKVMNISKLPTILVIHLKRFSVDIGTTYKKNHVLVRFPLTNLNIKPFLVSSYEQKETDHFNFDLYGISNHHGEMDAGHYTAFCKNPIYNKWFKYDDHNVLEHWPDAVQTSEAYILFYSRSR